MKHNMERVSMEKATARPWDCNTTSKRDGFKYRFISSGAREIARIQVNSEVDEANAAVIVRAVNSHEALIEALEMFADMVDDDKILTTTENREELIQALTMANEALRLARGA